MNVSMFVQNARAASRPDPYLTVTVGKKTENTAVQMRTDDPVYEIGYSFLVSNPEVDNLEIKVIQNFAINISIFVLYFFTLRKPI